MRKLWLVLGVLVVVIGIAYATTKGGSSPKTQTTTVPAGKPKARKTAWTGSAKREYDVTFLHSGQEITLVSIGYLSLNRPDADVFLNLTVPKAGPGLPAYVRPIAFHLLSPTGRVWLPQLTSTPVLTQSPPYWRVTLRFRGVPSRFLGNGQMQLSVAKPHGQFQIDLIPPPPPAGHSFAEAPALKKPKPHKRHLALCKKHQRSTKRHPCRKR